MAAGDLFTSLSFKNIMQENESKRDMTMYKKNGKDEHGFILVTALLMMVVLTIMSTFAMTISNLEQRVTSNSEVFQNNFYAVEATTLEAAARLDQTDDAILLDSTTFPAWLKSDNPAIDLTQSVQWPSALIAPSGTTLNFSPVDITPPGYAPAGGDRIMHAAIDKGVCAGGSLTNPTMEERCYDVFGMYEVTRGTGKAYTGRMLMTVGYKKILYY